MLCWYYAASQSENNAENDTHETAAHLRMVQDYPHAFVLPKHPLQYKLKPCYSREAQTQESSQGSELCKSLSSTLLSGAAAGALCRKKSKVLSKIFYGCCFQPGHVMCRHNCWGAAELLSAILGSAALTPLVMKRKTQAKRTQVLNANVYLKMKNP